MIETAEELKTFCISLNGGADIDATLLENLISNGKAIFEGERDWMVLRKVDTSKTVTPSNTWQTAIDLSIITDFSHFYGEAPIRLFDGDNRIQDYVIKPFDRRLEYKNVSYTAVYDENSKQLYLNGVVPYNGTLYISYVQTSDEVSFEQADLSTDIWTQFPTKFRGILAYYAVGIHKGAVDYDDINARMLPENRAALSSLKRAIEAWDDKKQNNTLESNDPTELSDYPRDRAINRYG